MGKYNSQMGSLRMGIVPTDMPPSVKKKAANPAISETK